MRFFNTAGPVKPELHYCLPPLERFSLSEVLSLIDQMKYFVLHAPRQTGKTSALLELMDYLNQEGTYKAVYLNVEAGQTARENVNEGIRAVLSHMGLRARQHVNDPFPEQIWHDVLMKNGGNDALHYVISLWAEKSDKPLVLLIDEIDSLIGDTLISVLRQLRSGYDKRPSSFPQSIILCGVRDVRDYRIHSDKEKAVITGGSAFNIKAESLRMGNFTKQEVMSLYYCHTEKTGQKFSDNALDTAWEYTEGQPWLVNALGYEACFKMKENTDRSMMVTSEMIHQAAEAIILRRETHLDQLADKLKEERVRKVIAPVLAGEEGLKDAGDDDIWYVRDLGLIRIEGNVRIANRIYQEVIPRALTYTTQIGITHETLWYVKKDGSLDMDKLLAAFQDFFRKHFDEWSKDMQYKEASAQLLMQAFLARIVNAGGQIYREYGLGRKRTDLLIIWRYGEKVQEVVIELKIRYGTTEKTVKEGLPQIFEYMDKCGADQGHLVIFDRRKSISWSKKIFRRQKQYKGRKISVWGM